MEDALTWAAAHSHPVADLADPKVAIAAVQAAIRDLDGKKPVIGSQRRNHGILKAALAYAVGEGLIDMNTITELEASGSCSVHQVDRRCVVNPRQARNLLDKAPEYGYEETERRQGMKSGPRLVAFFGSMYYAALRRPEETIKLHKHDLSLPAPKREIDADGREVVSYGWERCTSVRSPPTPGPSSRTTAPAATPGAARSSARPGRSGRSPALPS
ncbi:hypothetical protein ACFXKD_12135 [Nocardiopsis aegyptia]|uniref:hypothetical protein n=1 Tax=Nocardiopsis aegyptia TaxID=220378 RepID=UPI00366D6ED3